MHSKYSLIINNRKQCKLFENLISLKLLKMESKIKGKYKYFNTYNNGKTIHNNGYFEDLVLWRKSKVMKLININTAE